MKTKTLKLIPLLLFAGLLNANCAKCDDTVYPEELEEKVRKKDSSIVANKQ